MKIAFIGISNNLIQIENQEKVLHFLKSQLNQMGESFSLVSYFDNNFEKIKETITNNYTLTFFVGDSSSLYNHNIKESIARSLNDRLENNEACHKSLQKYCSDNNIQFSIQEETEIMIPSNAIPLCYNNNYLNGFMYNQSDKYFIFLPPDIDFVMNSYFDYIQPLINDISNTDEECMTLKCYGILEKDIRSIIADEIINPIITIQILTKRLDTTLYLRYKNKDSSEINNIISTICSKLQKFIYATEDVSLYKMASDLLSLQKKSIAIGETITLGNITRNLSDCIEVHESFLFTNFNSIQKNLRPDNKIIETYGQNSVNTIYEIDNLLLEKTGADIALFVLGSKLENKCFIAIGNIDGIHVYKNRINSFNDSLIDSISETAMFYLIKKLRQNDLQFL